MGRPFARKFTVRCLGPGEGHTFESTQNRRVGICRNCQVKIDQLARSGVYRGQDQKPCRVHAHTSLAN